MEPDGLLIERALVQSPAGRAYSSGPGRGQCSLTAYLSVTCPPDPAAVQQ